jgi:hypothetical protein
VSNEKNLIPNSERTPNELREMTSKGGKKSGEVRRRKKSMKQVMEILLAMKTENPADLQLLSNVGIDITELSEDMINQLLIVNVALLKKAKEGDVASIKELRDIIQDTPYQKHKMKIDKGYLDIAKKKSEQDDWN